MIGEAAALGSAALWATSTVVVKSVTGRLSASYIMAVRTGIAALLAFIVVLALRPNLHGLDLPTSTIAVLVVTGLIAITGDLCFVRAIALEDVSRVFTWTTSIYILFSVVGSVLFTGAEFSWFLPIGGVAILAGTRLVLKEPEAVEESGGGVVTRRRTTTAAIWLGLTASVLWAAGLLILTEAMKSTEPLSATIIRLPFMALVMGAAAGVQGDYGRFGLAPANLKVLALSGALGLGSMLLFLLSADKSDAGTVAVLTSTSPIFVVPLAIVFLGEKLTPRVATGTAACMAGIWLSVI